MHDIDWRLQLMDTVDILSRRAAHAASAVVTSACEEPAPCTDTSSATLARGVQLVDVPHRVQMPGKGCGLYALGMVLDYWHTVNPALETALVCDKDAIRRRLDKAVYSVEASIEERLLDSAASRGWCTAEGTVTTIGSPRYSTWQERTLL
jgi:hypothetical protein